MIDKEVPYGLIAKVVSGNCNNEEKHKIDKWRKESENNEIMFNQLKCTWLNDDKTQYQPDVEAALKKVYSRLDFNKNLNQKKTIQFKYLLRIAAIFLLGIGIFGVYKYFNLSDKNKIFIAKAEDNNKLSLPDGSVVFLNEHSSLSYPKEFAETERRVKLEGEAYFEISANKKKPFYIECQNTITKVVGTKFNIYSNKKDSLLKITVTEGIISLNLKTEPEKNKVLVKAGEVGKVNKESGVISKTLNNDLNFMSWRTGILSFDDVQPEEIMKPLSDFYGHEFILEKSSSLNDTITISFDINHFDDALNNLEMLLNVNIVETEKGYILKQKS